MTSEPTLKEIQNQWHGTLKSYAIGFIVSFLLTIASFLLVFTRLLSGNALIYTLVFLAILQATVQILFFLHVGQEKHPIGKQLCSS